MNVNRKEGSVARPANGRRGGRGLSLVVSGPATANVTSQVVECGHCRRLPSSFPSLSRICSFQLCPTCCSSHTASWFESLLIFQVRALQKTKKYWPERFYWNVFSTGISECLFPRSWVAVQWPYCRRRLLFRILELWFKQQILASIHLPPRHDPPQTKQKNV